MSGTVGTPCGGLVDCGAPASLPTFAPPRAPRGADYMAKDYDSLLRALLDQLALRAPDFRERSEADLGIALLELFAYVGDELSYYQDRVANEGFLQSAVQLESVRRLLRLIDYELSPGIAARAYLTFRVNQPFTLPAGFEVRSRRDENDADTSVFWVERSRLFYPELNELSLAAPAAAGAITLDLSASVEHALGAGSLLRLESPGHSEWVELDDATALGVATTRVTLHAPLAGACAAADTVVQGNVCLAEHGRARRQTAAGSGAPSQRIELEFAPLSYVLRGGKPASTLEVRVDGRSFSEVSDFVESGAADSVYRVTRDNQDYSTVEFGDGANGQAAPAGANIEIRYKTGLGSPGLVAAHTLVEYDDASASILEVDNPEPSFGAEDAESLELAKRRGPATLHQQARAVTLADYEEQALAVTVLDGAPLPSVPLHVQARFQWTGSFHAVVLSIDLADRASIYDHPKLLEALSATLRERKLVGYDIRFEAARYAPLYVNLLVHVKSGFFERPVRNAVERVLGARGFFAPGRFGFGQAVHLSDLYGLVMAVDGVERASVQSFKRLGDRHPNRVAAGHIAIHPLEIARCDNDPARPENGALIVRTCPGRGGS